MQRRVTTITYTHPTLIQLLTLLFYIHAHLKGEGGTGMEERIGEEGREGRGQYSRVQSVDDDCVRLFRSVSAVILLFLFLLPSAYLLVPKGTH